MKYLILLLPVFYSTTFAQYGYALDPQTKYLNDIEITVEHTGLPIPTLKEDVKAVGMGKTQIANGRTFNAMLYNPALLSRPRLTFDAINISISLPPETYDAANYLNDHIREFNEALSLREMWQGIGDFNNAPTAELKLTALKRIQSSLKFPRDLLRNVIGSPENPITHGIRTIPSVGLQIGNFGFSLYGIAQSAFEVEQSPTLDALLAIDLPENLNDPQQVANAVLSMQGILKPILELNDFREALPIAYSISYMDVVGALGYSYEILKDLNLGVNLKVVHRRFSARRILFEEYKEILNILKRDLNQYITGFTFDLGALYKFPTGTEAGFSIQNIIPVKKITSTLQAEFAFTYLDYKKDQFGNIILNNQGDTIVQSHSQNVKVGLPFDLELPMILNLGLVHPITSDWDAAFDLVDISEQDIRFEKYLERLRIGTEYRLHAMEKLGIIFRAGMADLRFAGGIGFNIFRAVQLDGAYAYDNYVGAYSYFAQIKIGW